MQYNYAIHEANSLPPDFPWYSIGWSAVCEKV